MDPKVKPSGTPCKMSIIINSLQRTTRREKFNLSLVLLMGFLVLNGFMGDEGVDDKSALVSVLRGDAANMMFCAEVLFV